MLYLTKMFMILSFFVSADLMAYESDDDYEGLGRCLGVTGGVCTLLTTAAEVTAPVLAYVSKDSRERALTSAIYNTVITVMALPYLGLAANSFCVKNTKGLAAIYGALCARTIEQALNITATVFAWLYWNSLRQGHKPNQSYRRTNEILTGVGVGIAGMATLIVFLIRFNKQSFKY